jgi:uncharacterized protein YkwD
MKQIIILFLGLFGALPSFYPEEICFGGNFSSVSGMISTSYQDSTPLMTEEEEEMIREINRLRSDPKGYIPAIEGYLEVFRNDGWSHSDVRKEERTARELIGELEVLSPLPQLEFHPGLYKAARYLGRDARKRDQLGHIDSRGQDPFERIKAFTELSGGGENLVAGMNTARESLISLLIDSGIAGRGHRKNILNKDWAYVACHNAGMIDGLTNNWIQLFGKE